VCDAERHCTPLLLACRYNDALGDTAAQLVSLTSGPMLNLVSRCGYTALTAAIESGKPRTVAALLRRRLLPCPITGNDDHVAITLDPQLLSLPLPSTSTLTSNENQTSKSNTNAINQEHDVKASGACVNCAGGQRGVDVEKGSVAGMAMRVGRPVSCGEAMEQGVVMDMLNVDRYMNQWGNISADFFAIVRSDAIGRTLRARAWIAQALTLARNAAHLHHATLLSAISSVLPNMPRPLLICAHLFHTPAPTPAPIPTQSQPTLPQPTPLL
jgi:hypothetical protein